MSDLFYRAFEEKFRGSRSLILSRLNIYQPFISPLKQICSEAQGLDLGCGRGEWLEMLQEEGIEPLGVDLDEGMLEASKALNLPVMKGDAVAYLVSLPSESQAVISAFHMVEHIPFDQLQLVVSEALRVLIPGGLLIMETPNSENIVVGTRNFYLDPTHQRPIPSLLLSFLPEYYGYERIKVMRLQESRTLLQNSTLGLYDTFEGVSPDYAVVAQKKANASTLGKFDDAFSREYGISLAALSAHYDLGIRGPIERVQSRLKEMEQQMKEMSSREQEQERTNAFVRELHSRLHESEARAHRAEHDALVATMALQAVHVSTSWRLSAPIRWISTQAGLLRRHGLRLRVLSLTQKLFRKEGGGPSSAMLAPTSNDHPEKVQTSSNETQTSMSIRVHRALHELKAGVDHPPKDR